MNRLYLIILILITFNEVAQGQIEWERTFGGSQVDVPSSVQQTYDGGYILAGYTLSKDGDVKGNHGSKDAWIIKLSIEGDTIWTKCFGGSGQDIARSIKQTSDSGYIFAGYSDSNDGDVSDSNGLMDYWVVKLTSKAELEWGKLMGGSGDDVAYSIDQTIDGGYIVAGYSSSNDKYLTENNGRSDYWIVKLDSVGDTIWTKTLGGSDQDFAYCIQQTSNHGYIVAGTSLSTDGDATGNTPPRSLWIVKLDSSGYTQWTKEIGKWGETGYFIEQTYDGGYIVAGHTTHNNGQVTCNCDGNVGDYWIVKLDSTGNIEWDRCIGEHGIDIPHSIQQTSDGGYIVAGETNYWNNFERNEFGQFDYRIVKLTQTGELEWEKTLGNSPWWNEKAYSIKQTSDGGYIVAGYSERYGDYNYWIVKLSVSTSNIDVIEPRTDIYMYPNPAQSVLFFNGINNEPTQISIYSLQGILIKQIQGTGINQIDINDLQVGVYLIKIHNSNGHLSRKLIKK